MTLVLKQTEEPFGLKHVEDHLEGELIDDLGLKDFEVDRIKERSRLYLGERTLDADVARSGRVMDIFLAGLSAFTFIICVVFCYIFLGIYQFVLVYAGVQALILAWRFVLAPLRHNDFASKELLVKYRCYLPQEKQMKAFIKDNPYMILAVIYVVLDFFVFLSFFDMPRMLVQLNNMIYNRGEFTDPLSQLSSLDPPLVIIGLVVNALGALLIAKFQRKDRGTGKVIGGKRATLLLSIAVVASIILLVAIGAGSSVEFTAFNKPSPTSDNWLYYFDSDLPLYRTRGVVFGFYFLVYLGSAVLALLIICGLAVMETTIMLGKLNAHWDRIPPVEPNWEFKATTSRHDDTRRRKIRARKFALGELAFICILAILAMWVFMKWGGEIMDIKWMNYVAYGLLGIIVLWGFFLSPVYHAKNDGKFHYPTARQNIAYALFDERGLGSYKYYFTNVFAKKKSLVAWTLYFLLMITAVFNFDEISLAMMNWKDMFQNPVQVPEGVIVDFVGYVIDAPYETAMSVVLVATAMSLVAFVAALGKKKEDFHGSGSWCAFFKVVVGLVVAACFFWITKIPQVTGVVNLLSTDFLVSLGMVVAFFGAATAVILFFVMPFIIKFDNLGATRRKIVEILLMTIVLLGLIIAIFHFVLPMTDIHGVAIDYGFPWRFGANWEVEANLDRFDLGVFMMEWCGRYIAWGGVQQFLFMSIFLTLWKKIFPRSKGAIIAVGTSCIFGVIHAIDWPLMIFTFIAGLFWAKGWHAEYYDPKTGRVMHGNNLFLWGLVHGFGGSLLGMLAPFTLGVGPFNMG